MLIFDNNTVLPQTFFQPPKLIIMKKSQTVGYRYQKAIVEGKLAELNSLANSFDMQNKLSVINLNHAVYEITRSEVHRDMALHYLKRFHEHKMSEFTKGARPDMSRATQIVSRSCEKVAGACTSFLKYFFGT